MYKIIFPFLLISITILPTKPGNTQSTAPDPEVPCAKGSTPTYPGIDQPLFTRVWHQHQIPDWVPPACLGWTAAPFDLLLAGTGRFRGEDDVAEIAQRVVSFSNLTNIRYWSVSHQKWRSLFNDAGALSRSDLESRRNDFINNDVQAGSQFHYFQDENTVLGPVIFRMTIRERKLNRLVFSSVNISALKVAFLDAVQAGRFEQYYVINRDVDKTWTYYSLVRTKINHGFLAPSISSSVNRASAYFRHIGRLEYESKVPLALK